MYHPGLGRFSTRDPIEYDAGDANLYRYVGNSAPNLTDPSGLAASEQRYAQVDKITLVTGPGSGFTPALQNLTTLPLYPADPGPHLDGQRQAYSFTVWVVFEGRCLDLLNFERRVNSTRQATKNGRLTLFMKEGSGYDELFQRPGKKDGPNFVNDFWMNEDKTVTVIADTPAVGFASIVRGARTPSGQRVGQWIPVGRQYFPVDYRWRYLVRATLKITQPPFTRGEEIARIDYGVSLVLPESRTYTEAEIQQKANGLLVEARMSMVLILATDLHAPPRIDAQRCSPIVGVSMPGKLVSKRRFQYTLRALLLLTAALALWLAYVTHRAAQQRKATRTLAAAGAELYYGDPFRESSGVFPMAYPAPKAFPAGCGYTYETGRHWQHVGQEGTEGILRWVPAWVDRDLFRTLSAVRLNYPDWKYKSDSANGRQLTEADFRALSKVVWLRGLDFDEAEFVTDEDLSYLTRLKHLERLYLASTNIGDAGLAHLSGLKSLRYLSLRGTNITDAGLVHLKGLTNLEMLELSDTDISDVGIEHLKSLKSLKYLYVPNTKITERGRKELEAALPGCEVADCPPGVVG